MKVQILGGGCPNCEKLEENARVAIAALGIDAEFEKVTDMDRIIEMGVMRTPALAIDGEVKKFGRVFTPDELTETFKEIVTE